MELPFAAPELLEAMPDASAILDNSGRIVATNRVWRCFSEDNGGCETRTGIGVNYVEVCRAAASLGDQDAVRVTDDLLLVMNGQAVERQYEYDCSSQEHQRWFRTRVTAIPRSSGMVLVSHLNITQEKWAEIDYRRQAETDQLTGLANRAGLRRATSENAMLFRGEPDRLGVIYMDLDGFKAVNDRLGHLAGDELLQIVSSRIRSSTKGTDLVARLGGDEFAILARVKQAGDLTLMAERIATAIAQPMLINGHEARVAASAGWRLLSEDESLDEGLNHADLQMLENKRRRKAEPGPGIPPPEVVALRSAAVRTTSRHRRPCGSEN